MIKIHIPGTNTSPNIKNQGRNIVTKGHIYIVMSPKTHPTRIHISGDNIKNNPSQQILLPHKQAMWR